MEVLAAVVTTWPGDFGGMRVLQIHKGENTNDRGAGLESGGNSFRGVMGRPLLREDVQNKDCRVYSYVYLRNSVWRY